MTEDEASNPDYLSPLFIAVPAFILIAGIITRDEFVAQHPLFILSFIIPVIFFSVNSIIINHTRFLSSNTLFRGSEVRCLPLMMSIALQSLIASIDVYMQGATVGNDVLLSWDWLFLISLVTFGCLVVFFIYIDYDSELVSKVWTVYGFIFTAVSSFVLCKICFASLPTIFGVPLIILFLLGILNSVGMLMNVFFEDGIYCMPSNRVFPVDCYDLCGIAGIAGLNTLIITAIMVVVFNEATYLEIYTDPQNLFYSQSNLYTLLYVTPLAVIISSVLFATYAVVMKKRSNVGYRYYLKYTFVQTSYIMILIMIGIIVFTSPTIFSILLLFGMGFVIFTMIVQIQVI